MNARSKTFDFMALTAEEVITIFNAEKHLKKIMPNLPEAKIKDVVQKAAEEVYQQYGRLIYTEEVLKRATHQIESCAS